MDQTARRLIEHTLREMENIVAGGWPASVVADNFMDDSRKFIEQNRIALVKLNQRYRLGCISNNWGNTAGWCKQFGLDSLFETMVDSAVVDSIKPDRRIFEAALDELALTAENCVYVGDRFDCDMEGAYAMGMKTVWVVGNGKNIPEGANAKAVTWQIAGVTGLLDVFEM